jgi:Sec-independent protein translocase protein TatA
LTLFEKLCGKGAYQNVILTTTMWDKIDESMGSMREEELRKTYWKAMVSVGSGLARFRNTHDSAWEIVARFTRPRVPLKLQVEMVDKGLDLAETAAGLTLFRWLGALIAQFRKLISQMEAKLKKAIDIEEAENIAKEKSVAETKCDQAGTQKQLLGSKVKRSRSVPRSRRTQPNLGDPPKPALGSLNARHREEGDNRGRALAATIVALRHTRDVAKLSSLPFFKGAVQLILTIAESVEVCIAQGLWYPTNRCSRP